MTIQNLVFGAVGFVIGSIVTAFLSNVIDGILVLYRRRRALYDTLVNETSATKFPTVASVAGVELMPLRGGVSPSTLVALRAYVEAVDGSFLVRKRDREAARGLRISLQWTEASPERMTVEKFFAVASQAFGRRARRHVEKLHARRADWLEKVRAESDRKRA